MSAAHSNTPRNIASPHPLPSIVTVMFCPADEPFGSWADSMSVPVLFNCWLASQRMDETPVAYVFEAIVSGADCAGAPFEGTPTAVGVAGIEPFHCRAPTPLLAPL